MPDEKKNASPAADAVTEKIDSKNKSTDSEPAETPAEATAAGDAPTEELSTEKAGTEKFGTEKPDTEKPDTAKPDTVKAGIEIAGGLTGDHNLLDLEHVPAQEHVHRGDAGRDPNVLPAVADGADLQHDLSGGDAGELELPRGTRADRGRRAPHADPRPGDRGSGQRVADAAGDDPPLGDSRGSPQPQQQSGQDPALETHTTSRLWVKRP